MFLLLLLSFQAISQKAETHYQTGIGLQNEKKYGEAIENYDKALQVDAKYYDAIYQRAYCNNRLKNYDQAMSDLRVLENKKA